MEVARLYEMRRGELIGLVLETLMRLRGQFSILVLKLQILRNPPIVVLPLRDSHEFVSVLLNVRIPLTLLDGDWDHRLAKHVLVPIDEVPYRECSHDLVLSLLGARDHKQHVTKPREFDRVYLCIADGNLIEFFEVLGIVDVDAGESVVWAKFGKGKEVSL